MDVSLSGALGAWRGHHVVWPQEVEVRSGCVEALLILPELELQTQLAQTPALWQLWLLGWNTGVTGVHSTVPAAVVSIDQQKFPGTACAL